MYVCNLYFDIDEMRGRNLGRDFEFLILRLIFHSFGGFPHSDWTEPPVKIMLPIVTEMVSQSWHTADASLR